MGTGEVRFEGICFFGPDDDEGAPRSGGGLTVGLTVIAERPVRVSSLAVKVSIPHGPLLIGADPLIDADLPLEFEPGRHRVRVDIESVDLSPGSYTIGVSMARGGSGRAWSVFDSVDDAVQLDLEPAIGEGARRGQGIVPSRSSLTHLSHAARPARRNGEQRHSASVVGQSPLPGTRQRM